MSDRHVETRSGHRASLVLASLVSGALVAALACSTWNSGDDDAPTDDPIVATVNGEAIRLGDLDERIRRELFEREFDNDPGSLYEARSSTIDDMIDERLLNEAARAAGVPADDYLEGALDALPPVSDAEIQQLFDDNLDRLPPGATLEDYETQLRAHLDGQRIGQVFANLRNAANVEISVPRERIDVAATGPALGPLDAPVVIIEFSDFQCPFCARAVPILKALHDRHPDDVRIVFRHMPLSFHGNARIAAIGAVCAEAQGRFWDYHDALFANQKALGRDDLIAQATALGLDSGAFATCLDDPASAAVVDSDNATAVALGLTGTPTFFVNGLKLTGARPLEQFEAIIAEEKATRAP